MASCGLLSASGGEGLGSVILHGISTDVGEICLQWEITGVNRLLPLQDMSVIRKYYRGWRIQSDKVELSCTLLFHCTV